MIIVATGTGGCEGCLGVGYVGKSCGNGVIDPHEDCDGQNLDGETCESLGFGGGGELRCDYLCRWLDDSQCVDGAICGDGVAEDEEACDGEDLRELTCASLGLSGAGLRCENDCRLSIRYCGCERCDNRWDDDNDGLVDCNDPDCAGVGACPLEICHDGVDNDDNGLTDCEDFACAANFPQCNGGIYPLESSHVGLCGNDLDDDNDGLDDAHDPDCFGLRGQLFIRDENCADFAAGDKLFVEVQVYADATDLGTITVNLGLPPEISWAREIQTGTYDADSHAMSWVLDDLAHGSAVTVRFEAQIDPELYPGGLLCLQAMVASATPLAQWVTDDPLTPDALDPTCVTVR